jgi:hypothetical protein
MSKNTGNVPPNTLVDVIANNMRKRPVLRIISTCLDCSRIRFYNLKYTKKLYIRYSLKDNFEITQILRLKTLLHDLS